MIIPSKFVTIPTVVAALCVTAPPLMAQQKAQTAAQFYMEYRAAFAKAKTVEQIFPYMAKESREEAEATPAAQRKDMFAMMKILNNLRSVKVVSETAAGETWTLEATALDTDRTPMKGTITIVREDGAWKVGKESWSSGR